VNAEPAGLLERRLEKTLRWWDGFIIGLANPGFLLVGLGSSVAALGATVAAVLWPLSAAIGGLQAYLYAELAASFPEKTGGIPVYAMEAWRRYFPLAGPLAAFGYWFAWSSVLAIYGGLIGLLLTGEFLFTPSPHDSTQNIHPIGSFHTLLLGIQVTTPRLIGLLSILSCWVFNIRGMKTAVWLTYLTGAMMLVPLFVLAIGPFLTGHVHAFPISHSQIASSLRDTFHEPTGSCQQLAYVMVWLYIIGWSTYGPESLATFAPEFVDSGRDTRKAIAATAIFNLVLTALMPIAIVGTVGHAAIAQDRSGVLYLTRVLDSVAGPTLGSLCVLFLCAGLLLTMNTATMDGSRALYAMAREGLTVKQLGVLNRHNVPGRAMTCDMILNVVLLFAFPGIFFILAAGNLGYMVTHILTLSGFLLLRRDQPDRLRSLRLGRVWPWLALGFAAFNVGITLLGVFQLKLTGYAWDDAFTDPTAYVGRCIGVSLLILLAGAAGYYIARK
jgi:amino acid transporter